MAERPKHSRETVNEIFGDALLPTSPDDRDGSSPDDSERDRWLQENTPPHHQ
jgi:hypothetical protein